MASLSRHRLLRVGGGIALWLWTFFLLWLVPPPMLSAEMEGHLDRLLWRYIDTPDSSEADQLLQQILHHEQASIERVSALFQQGRAYTVQPTGLQPNVPVRVRGASVSYALAVPNTYDPAKAYGLVLCLHGAGFTGDAYLERWESRLGDRYLLACPTYRMGAWWTRGAEELVLATLQDVVRRYHVDPDRVFLTGMSNGGIGAWIIGMHHADLFAGIAPMASGIDEVLFPFLANLQSTPLYIIHGARDQVMPVSLSRDIVEELKKLGYPFVYREHEGEHPIAGGHYFPKEELPDLIAWLDQQRRRPDPTALALVRDATHLEPMAWLRIDATDRIAAFPESLIESPDRLIKGRVYAKIRATIKPGNHIDTAAVFVRRYTLLLNDHLISTDQPLQVTTNGQDAFNGRPIPSLETLLRHARLRQDTHRLYPMQVTVTVP